MKKILKGLLAAALMVSGVEAAKFSNQTYMAVRDTHSANSQMNSLGGSGASTKKFRATFHVGGFYRESHKEKDAAAYYGAGQATDKNQDGTIAIVSGDGTANHATQGLFGHQVDHSQATPATSAMGTVSFAPKRKEVGAQVSWNQNLNSTVEGLSFYVNVPVARVEHDLGFKATSTANPAGGTIAQYFSGAAVTKAAGTAPADAQGNLAYGKMDATKRKVTNVADVAAGINYRFVQEADYCVCGGLNFMVPVSNKPTGEFLFEPVLGNAGKFAFGANLNSCFNMWRHKTKNMALDLKVGGDYRYTFEGSEHRILGIYNHKTEKLLNAGHYRNLVKHGGLAGVPSANVLRREVDVTPGSQFALNAGFCFKFKACTFDASYNLRFAQEENVKLKASNKWFDTTYGLAAHNATMSTAGVSGLTDHTVEGSIQAQGTKTAAKDSAGTDVAAGNAATHYVSTAACTTPSQVTHKVGGSLSFAGLKKLPVSLTVGGAYEFDANNANRSLVSWDVWAKLGFSF